MRLPGRLGLTTLGDVLGALYRAQADGVLELVEVQGVSSGRRHRVFLHRGLVEGVETVLAAAHGLGVRARLDALFHLGEALLRFHVPRPFTGARPVPLSPDEALRGRPRARARRAEASLTRPSEAELERARRTLGVPRGADRGAVLRAFRRLAQEAHPDRHPEASAEQKRVLLSRFSELSSAYHALSA